MTLMEIEPVQRAQVGEWWIAVARPQYEERLSHEIETLGAFAFVPLEMVVKTYTDKRGCLQTKRWNRPIFGNYLFYRGDRDVAFESELTIGVLRTSPRDCEEIENIMRAYAAGPVRRANITGLELGTKVKIVSGSFMGCEGEILKFGDTKVFLKVATLGHAEIETDQANIEPFYGD